MESERLKRDQMKSKQPFHFSAEKVTMANKHGNVELCNMIAIPDLAGLVLRDHHQKPVRDH